VNWIPIPNVPGGALRLSATSAEVAWAINSNQEIFEFSKGNWAARPGAAKDIAACADGTAWVIGTNATPGGFGIFRWDGGPQWRQMPGAAIRLGAHSSVDAVVVNDQGLVFEFDQAAQNWKPLPPPVPGVTTRGDDIAIGPGGTIGLTHHPGISIFEAEHVSFFSRERNQRADIDGPVDPTQVVNASRPFQIDIGPNGLPWIVDGNTIIHERVSLAP
jgi:hypothetical protein